MEAYNQLFSDLLFGMTLQDWPKLTCKEFAKCENFSIKDGNISFLDLAPFDTIKSLFLALLNVVAKPELR